MPCFMPHAKCEMATWMLMPAEMAFHSDVSLREFYSRAFQVTGRRPRLGDEPYKTQGLNRGGALAGYQLPNCCVITVGDESACLAWFMRSDSFKATNMPEFMEK